MKVINSKLAAIGLAAFVFVSCSDSTNDNGGSPTPVTPGVLDATTIELTKSDAASLLSRVTNYKNSTTNARKFFGTRADAGTTFPSSKDFELPVENGTMSINGAGDLTAGKTYSISGSNKSIDMTGKNLNGATIFVHSGTSLTIDANANATIILGYASNETDGTTKNHQGGTLVLGGNTIPAGCKVITYYGEIKAEGDITVAGELYANYRGETGGTSAQALQTGIGAVEMNTVNPTQNITFAAGSKAYINGSIRAKKLTIASGATVTTDANVLNSTEVDVAGAIKVAGFLKAATLNVTGEIDATETSSAIKVTKEMNMENGGTVNANYINVTDNTYSDKGETLVSTGNATLNLKKGSHIYLAPKSVLFINNLVTDNESEGQVTLNAEGLAVVKADKFTYNGTESKIQAFSTPVENATLLFQFNQSWHGADEQIPSQADLDLGCSYYDYDQATNGSAVGLKEEANKQYGYELKVDATDITKQTKLDLVAAVDAANRDGMSATCIQPVGSYIYTSYHTYGNGKTSMGGGLEVSHIDGNQVTIDASLMKDGELDINHLLYDNGKLYVAGSSKKEGALFGYVDANDATLGSTLTTYPLNVQVKNGYDANVVVKYQNNYVMSSTRGYEIFEPSTFNHSLVATTKEAKGLAVSGNKLYSLIANNGSTVTAGELRSFDNDAELANATKVADTPNISPVDGKNTVAVDDNDVYVCCGENGLVRYTNGTENGKFACPTIQNEDSEKHGHALGYCNGVAVDSKYVYVACGGYGLVVLDKSTLKEVCHRKAYNSGYNADGTYADGATKANSANYVAVSGDYIYVAYGKSRVQVFKVTNTGN